MSGRRERFAVAGVMIIAGEYAFPVRSLAPARSLFNIHCVRRGYALFSPANSVIVSSGEDDGDDGGAILRPVLRLVPRLVLRSVFSSRLISSRASSLRVVASRRRRSHITAPSLSRAPALSNPPTVAHSVSFFVPSCVSLIVSFSCRLALSLRSHPVSSCPMCRTLAAAPFCSAHLVVILPCLAALIAS